MERCMESQDQELQEKFHQGLQEEELTFDVDADYQMELQNKKSRKSLESKIKKEKRKKRLASGLEFVVYVGIAVIITYLVLNFIGQRTVVEGNSMWPTLNDGESLIVDKLTYHFQAPKRFDIIVFPYQENNGREVYYIKRIIGLPGESIQISDNQILIDGKVLEEEYGYGQYTEGGYAEKPLYLGADEYFVIGDNRSISKDSRYLNDLGQPEVGCIHRDEILGRAVFRIWPLSEFGKIKTVESNIIGSPKE